MKKSIYWLSMLLCCLFFLGTSIPAEAAQSVSEKEAGVSFYKDEEEEEEEGKLKEEANGPVSKDNSWVSSGYRKAKLPQTGETGINYIQIAGLIMFAVIMKGGIKRAGKKVDESDIA